MRFILVLLLSQFALQVQAKEYPIFDGRFYNGLFYPRINVIEWDQPEYLVFNIYSKEKPVDLTGVVKKSGNQKIFSIQYHLKSRDEKICRSVIAPKSFKVGQKLNFYVDKSDKRLDQIYVSAKPMKKEKYVVKPFTGCKDEIVPKREVASVKPPKPKKIKDIPIWFDDQPDRSNNFDMFGEAPKKKAPDQKIYLFD